MFTRIDHIMIGVPDLALGIEQYRKLGFHMHAGGVHVGKGTHNAIAFNQDDYIELLAIRDQAEYDAGRIGRPDASLTEFVAAGGGIRYIIIQSDDLAADVAAMRSRGIDVTDALDAGRRTPAGHELRWKAALPGPANKLPLIFIQHLTPLEERRKQVPSTEHPNRVYTLERAYVVTDDAEATAAVYAKVLGIPQPAMQRGTVIMSNMASVSDRRDRTRHRATVCPRPGGRRAGAPRPRTFPGALSHFEHGRGRALDGRARRPAPPARYPQHR